MSQLVLIDLGDRISDSPMAQYRDSLADRNPSVLSHSVLLDSPSLRNQWPEDSILHHRHSTLCSVDHGDLLDSFLLSLSLGFINHMSSLGDIDKGSHRLQGL